MAITLPTEDELFSEILKLYQVQFPTQDLTDKGFLGLNARAIAQAMMLFEYAVLQADNDSVPAYKQDADGTLLSNCSSAALDYWAITYGLPSGTPGIYGRKGATGSSGGVGTPGTTAAAVPIPSGSQLTDPTGTIIVETTDAIVTNGPPNTIPVGLRSVTKGAAANIASGVVLTWVTPIAGVNSTMTLTSPLIGGEDRETDGALLARILFRLQNPPRGGTAADYRYWTETSTDSANNDASNGIFRAYVFPLRSGGGSVDVVPLVEGQGAGRKPGSAVLAAVQTYLDRVRPVTATVNVVEPSFPANKALRLRAVVQPQDLYAYDWNDAGVASVIKAGSTTTTVVILTVNFRTELKNAIDAGSKPRIQVINTTAGATVQPYVRQVISYQNNVPAAGDTTLVLSTAMDVAPSVGDYFYAGGPVVETIADNWLAYVDSLGPSRESGFADEFDPWDYQVTLARLADIVMEARDGNGTRMVRDIPDLTTTGLQIAVGAGAFTSDSYTPKDLFGLPEVAYLRVGGIEIVQYT